MTEGAFLDDLGFLVDVGTVVGFREMFETPENAGKSYVVTALPNWGDMVVMHECDLDESGNPVNEANWDITVAPYKIGAI